MNIEVGDYVRTRDGKIGVFKRYIEGRMYKWLEIIQGSTLHVIPIVSVAKHSKNIIDLLKEGDIIKWEGDNGCYYGVNEILQGDGYLGVYAQEADYIWPLENMEILKVLTYEQYQANCYTVEGRNSNG